MILSLAVFFCAVSSSLLAMQYLFELIKDAWEEGEMLMILFFISPFILLIVCNIGFFLSITH